jgi:hypothetical protein
MAGLWAKTRTTLEMIKWEHSIFALPFALTAVLLAGGWPWSYAAFYQVEGAPGPSPLGTGEESNCR